MVEIIIMMGVLGNFFLQTYWFFWSREIHERKHLTDEDFVSFSDFDKEVTETERDYYKEQDKVKQKRIDDWSEFNNQEAPSESKEPKEKKFNPDEVKGIFDDVFK